VDQFVYDEIFYI